MNVIAQTAFTVYADVIATAATLSGSTEPAFPESYHDILIEGVLMNEYKRSEKLALAQDAKREYESRLSDLRLWMALSPNKDLYQNKLNSSSFSGSGSGGSGSSVNGALSYTQTGLITFDRDPSAPFAVTSGSAVVTNLNAELLGGFNSTEFGILAQNESVTGAWTFPGTGGATTLRIGPSAVSSSTSTVALGNTAAASAASAIAIGLNSIASAADTIAIGSQAEATGAGGIAIGFDTVAPIDCVAIGYGALGGFLTSVAVGSGASAGTSGAGGNTAIGDDAQVLSASDDSATMVGRLSKGTSRGTALGFSALSRARGVALGYQAIVDTGHDDSLAFGLNALTTQSSQMIVGSSTNPIRRFRLGEGVQSIDVTWGGNNTGTNVAAGPITFNTGVGTGTGTATSYTFATSDTTGSGTGAQSLSNKLVISSSLTSACTGGLVLTDTAAGIKERGRSTALGEWTSPAFSAGDYTASTGNWTVDSGDVTTFAYILVGKMMTIMFQIQDTDVSATPSNLIRVIPGGFTATKTARNTFVYQDAGGANTVGLVSITGGTTSINFAKLSGNWSTTAADNTAVLGQITFEVT